MRIARSERRLHWCNDTTGRQARRRAGRSWTSHGPSQPDDLESREQPFGHDEPPTTEPVDGGPAWIRAQLGGAGSVPGDPAPPPPATSVAAPMRAARAGTQWPA